MQADLLIHVLDASNPRVHEYNKAVLDVLKELKVDTKPMITVLNKIDLMEYTMWLEQLRNDFVNSVPISAKLNQNLETLVEKINENFKERMVWLEIVIPHSRMDLVDLFYREGNIEEIKYLQKGINIKLTLPKVLSEKIMHEKDIDFLD